MKAEEIRIGNLVKEGTIDAILFNESLRKCEVIKENGARSFEYIELLTPIPLTEQWLLDFGFQIDGVWCYLDFEPRMQIRFYGGNSAECDIVQYGKFIAFKNGHIKYVHQLQNLFYALAGQELELNKK